MNMQHYKFIHFFWHNDLKFYPNLVRTVNNPQYGFTPEEHLFVTPYKTVFNKLSNYSNVVFFDTQDPHSAEMVNHYAPYGDWLFIHSIPSWLKILYIKREYLKKIIWRTWGHDTIPWNTKENFLSWNFKNKILSLIRICLVHRFFAVGVSSSYIDILDIRRNFGNVKTVPISYPNPDVCSLFTNELFTNKRDTLNILVGHSGFCADNHINILQKLERFKNENICIYLIFSYGNVNYMNVVTQYVNRYWPQKVKIITDFMPIKEFQQFCKKIDVAIFDGLNSYAIGSVSTFLCLRKKLVFNRKGLWHKAFSDKDAPHLCSDEVDSISFEEFKKPFCFKKDKYDGLEKLTFEDHLKNWKNLLDHLVQETNKQNCPAKINFGDLFYVLGLNLIKGLLEIRKIFKAI